MYFISRKSSGVGAREDPTVLRTSARSFSSAFGWLVSIYSTKVNRQAVYGRSDLGRCLLKTRGTHSVSTCGADVEDLVAEHGTV
jgi:hypothetical protein